MFELTTLSQIAEATIIGRKDQEAFVFDDRLDLATNLFAELYQKKLNSKIAGLGLNEIDLHDSSLVKLDIPDEEQANELQVAFRIFNRNLVVEPILDGKSVAGNLVLNSLAREMLFDLVLRQKGEIDLDVLNEIVGESAVGGNLLVDVRKIVNGEAKFSDIVLSDGVLV